MAERNCVEIRKRTEMESEWDGEMVMKVVPSSVSADVLDGMKQHEADVKVQDVKMFTRNDVGEGSSDEMEKKRKGVDGLVSDKVKIVKRKKNGGSEALDALQLYR